MLVCWLYGSSFFSFFFFFFFWLYKYLFFIWFLVIPQVLSLMNCVEKRFCEPKAVSLFCRPVLAFAIISFLTPRRIFKSRKGELKPRKLHSWNLSESCVLLTYLPISQCIWLITGRLNAVTWISQLTSHTANQQHVWHVQCVFYGLWARHSSCKYCKESCQMWMGRNALPVEYSSRLLSLTNGHILIVHMLLDSHTQPYIMLVAG